jgi:hypothetical protein
MAQTIVAMQQIFESTITAGGNMNFINSVFTLAFLNLLLSGCSSMQGMKLGKGTDDRLVAPNGIPFTMVRPEYSLSRTAPAEGEKKPKYSLSVSYETDPDQMYALKISPGLLADADFVMKLGAGGILQGTTTTLTEIVTPTITALGSFSKDLIGTLATGALDSASVRNALKADIENHAACKISSDVPISRIPLPNGAAQTSRTISDEIKRRADDFIDDDEFGNLFHYVTDLEKICLESMANAAKTRVETTHKGATETWKNTQSTYLTKYPKDVDYIGLILKLVSADDYAKLKELSDENMKVGKEGSAAEKSVAADRSVLFADAEAAMLGITETDLLKKMEFFVKMDKPTWLGRHVLYIEREIANVELARLRRPSIAQDVNVASYLNSLHLMKAIALGVRVQYERSLVLVKFLREVPNKTERGGTAPAAGEYVALRGELDSVLIQIDARRTRVLSDMKAPPSLL